VGYRLWGLIRCKLGARVKSKRSSFQRDNSKAAKLPVQASWGSAVRFSHVLNGFFFVLWVAICSASPEFLWQGLVSLFSHFTWLNGAVALLIGAILAFFVEPVLERLRGLNKHVTHVDKSPAFAACTALSFAFVAVCVHEAITVYIDASHENELADRNLFHAVSQAIEWAVIPFAITVAWLSARARLWLSVPVTVIAELVIYLTGVWFDWSVRDILTTAIPCTLILAAGYVCVRQRWDHLTFRRCARLTAFIAIGWLAISGALQVGLSLGHVESFQAYEWSEFGIDFRFYVGWVIGLVVAPGLVAEPREHVGDENF
jgi:hypothetical protein